MLSRAVVAAIVLCCSFEAAAKPKNKAKEKKPTCESEDATASCSSAAVRPKKPITAAVLYTPLSDFVLQYGAGGMYQLNTDVQLGFNFLMGSESVLADLQSDDTLEFTQADLSGMAFYGYGRYYFGDTFNATAGLGYRSATVAYRIEDRATNDFLKGDLAISSIIMPIAIGNHWSWDSGLTIGVDWLTYMLAISGSSKGSTETSFEVLGTEVEDLNQDMVDLGDGLAKTSTLTLALVYLGYSF